MKKEHHKIKSRHSHKESGGHEGGRHAGHSPDMFRAKFWLSLLLTLPVVYFSEHIQGLLGYEAPVFFLSDWIPAVLATAVFLYGGLVFLKSAKSELKNRLPGMMTLISLAITVAFLFSWVVRLGIVQAQAIWWELATLVTIMLLGHWIEMKSVQQASGTLQKLAKLLPDTAVRIVDGKEEKVEAGSLNTDDIVQVRPGENIPADGRVEKGNTEVNESMITGESRPVKKRPGDEVVAGTINGDGSLHVRVMKTGEDTKLSGIMRLVMEAQESKSQTQHLADRAARLLTFVATGAGIITMTAWLILGASIDFSIIRMVTVLVIACPHALGLAVPLVVSISTTLGARSGLLVRDRRGLEQARELDTVIFDKTGTLTLGEFRVKYIETSGDMSEEQALSIAAAIEKESEHPIGRGIVGTAREKGVDIPAVSDFRALKGKGVFAVLGGKSYYIGGPALFSDADIPEELAAEAEEASRGGESIVFLFQNKRALALFAISDAVRDESIEAVRMLKEMGVEVAMLTGDSHGVAEAVAAELKIDVFFSEVLPEDKASKVKQLQKQGKKVAMVGDGVNDAPALATADVGIAIGAGTDVAVEAGHIVLVRSDPQDLPRIVSLSRATYTKMLQNLWWAAGYNIVAIPLAAGVLYKWGILLTPALGAVLMSVSTVIVALNAQLLRKVKL